jgi:NAD(P)H dehydrogenase (quinone)
MGYLAITGASGQLGRLVAEASMMQAAPRDLVLITREPSGLENLAARGAQVRHGDFDQPDTLRRAFAGVERLLLISAVDLMRRSAQHRAAIDAAVSTGVQHIVYTSMLSPQADNPAAVAPSHRETEEALRRSGLIWTLLRNSLYADYQVPEAQQAIATGCVVHNRGSGRIAYVSRADCAAVAARVLTSPGHENLAYDITGPQLVDAAELAQIYAGLGRRSVQTEAVADAALIAVMLAGRQNDGHAQYGASLVASFGRAIREGYFETCSTAVADLTGRPAQALEAVLAQALGARSLSG